MKLIADQIAAGRGSRMVISGLSFTLAGGEGLLLRGPNGAGKTTLLRTLAGFIRPARGALTLEGGDPERELGEQCHYIGHLNGIKSSFTAMENLAFYAAFLDGGDGAVGRALDAFGLTELGAVPAGLFSAGQKRRLGLARLLVARRPVWLLDEPTVSLDAAAQALLAEVIGDHLRRGGMVVAATHAPLGLPFAHTMELGRYAAAGSGERAAS